MRSFRGERLSLAQTLYTYTMDRLDALRKRADRASFAVEAWRLVTPALKLASWISPGGGVAANLPGLLTLDDPSGQLAKHLSREEYRSNSSDPYLRAIDNMLYNNGQPLTAGSAALYGTYFDPRTGAAFKLTAVAAMAIASGIVGFFAGGPAGAAIGAGMVLADALRDDGLLNSVGTAIGSPSSQGPQTAHASFAQFKPILVDAVNFEFSMLAIAGEARAMGRIGEVTARAEGARTVAEAHAARASEISRCEAIGQGLRACFSGRMLIDVDGGKKRADQIKRGDLVASRNEDDAYGPVEYKELLEVFVNVAEVYNLHVAGAIIETTSQHPFFVVGEGWVEAGDLQIGDVLSGRDGRFLAVQGVAPSGAVETVYNWRVRDYHTYFVGKKEWGFAVWAHNACNNPDGQHGKPDHRSTVAALVTKAMAEFKGMAVDIIQGKSILGQTGVNRRPDVTAISKITGKVLKVYEAARTNGAGFVPRELLKRAEYVAAGIASYFKKV